MFNGNLTGWKAIAAAIVIVGLIGAKVWNRTPHYRTFCNESATLAVDEFQCQEIILSGKAKLRITTQTDPPAKHMVCILDQNNYRKLNTDETPTFLFKEEGDGALETRGIALPKGTFYVLIANGIDKEVAVKYKVLEHF